MSLHEHDGIHVCGKVLDHDLLIPTNALELECFMDGRTLAALFSLRVCDFFNVVAVVKRLARYGGFLADCLLTVPLYFEKNLLFFCWVPFY